MEQFAQGRARAPGGCIAAGSAAPLRVVVMGVSGCGKSTLAGRIAQALGLSFVEGDDFHPPDNVARMAAGVPLTDADRAAWLAALADRLVQARVDREGIAMSCSALKRAYRDRLRAGGGDLAWIHLDGPAELIAQRMAERPHHYMPPALLQSQLAALESPERDECALRLDLSLPLDSLHDQALAWLRARPTFVHSAARAA